MLTDVIKALEKDLKLTAPLPVKAGVYTLTLDNQLEIFIGPFADGISLTSKFAPCPQTNPEDFFSELLRSNLFGQATRGAFLGLSPDGKHLTLSKIIDYNNIEYSDFKNVLEEFITIIDYWQDKALEKK